MEILNFENLKTTQMYETGRISEQQNKRTNFEDN